MADTQVPASRTARERARAELTREIREEARRQLAATGAGGLSLRAVARRLGMVSSALYRYYPSRDDLLTALIIDAYEAIGDAAERAIAAVVPGAPAGTDSIGGTGGTGGTGGGTGGGIARARWLAACHAIRAWAVANPHEYALIYGSPVPGYRAPAATVGPASRVPLAFVGVLRDAIAAGELQAAGNGPSGPGDPVEPSCPIGSPSPSSPPRLADGGQEAGPRPAAPQSLAGALADQAAALSAALAAAAPGRTASPGSAARPGASSVPEPAATPGQEVAPALVVPPGMLVRAVIAWTQLFGMLSFELFGQLVGSFEPADALFEHAAAQLATFVFTGLATG